jgi:beta-lactamase regulating signal transducer with metallopeptidase domain/protocatechuate 3,4-dioxygenase beta subunit
MSGIEAFTSETWVTRLGWTLVHFLWQGTAIAVGYTVVRFLLARFLSANARYTLACAALLSMGAAPPVTFFSVSRPVSASASGASWTLAVPDWQWLPPFAVVLWGAGVIWFSIRLFGAVQFTHRLRTTSHPAPEMWQRMLERIAARMGWPFTAGRRHVRLMGSSMVNVPAVIGCLRPVVLVPVEFLTGAPAEHVVALLTHEMAHICRNDYLAGILQSVLEVALFYHPAVWWISRQIRIERELCCDDLVIAAGTDRLIYARALTDLESARPHRLTPGLAANGGSLMDRIRRLIEPSYIGDQYLPGTGSAWAMVALLLVGVGVVPVHGAQDKSPSHTADLASATVAGRTSSAYPDQPAGTFESLMGTAQKTLLYDPVFSAQLAQPHPMSGQPANPNGLVAEPLSGRVVEDDNNVPLASVGVRLSKTGQPRLVADLDTDSSGNFAVPDLTPGDYRLVLSKPNFLGTTLDFKIAADGEKIAHQFRLIRGATISGQVTDSSGHPLPGGFVYAMPRPAEGDSFRPVSQAEPQMLNGAVSLAPLDSAGRYRLYNLPPGQYAVVAAWGATRQRAAQFGSSSALTGLGTGLQFYPSNSAPSLFTLIGGEQVQANFTIGSPQTWSVSGKIDRELKPSEGRFWLGLVLPDQPGLAIAAAQTDQKGAFTFEGIPAGNYDLLVSGPSRGYGGAGGILEPAPQYARMHVVVSGQNVTGVVVSPAPGRSASFVLKRTNNSCPDSAALSITSLEDWTTVLSVNQTIGLKPQNVDNLAPGRFRVSASVSGDACYAVARTVNIGQENGVIEVVISPAGAIRGIIRGGIDGTGANARFLAVLTDPESSAAARVAHPDESGAFSFNAIPPGHYRLSAAPASETSQARWVAADPRASNVNVTGGATVSLDLDVPGPAK